MLACPYIQKNFQCPTFPQFFGTEAFENSGLGADRPPHNEKQLYTIFLEPKTQLTEIVTKRANCVVTFGSDNLNIVSIKPGPFKLTF